MKPVAEVLGEFVAAFDLKTSPKRVSLMEKAKLHLLDGIGVGLASTTAEDHYSDRLMDAVRGFGSAPQCAIIGYPDRAAPSYAAFANGSFIHGCEFDDRYLERVVHTESFGVAVGLALGEYRGLDGWALMEAWLIAAEVAIRLALGCNKEGINGNGFHTTSIFGTVGAAAAAAKLLGLDADRAARAMALSVSFASGTTEGWNEGSGRNKSIQPGWAAMSGIMAAQMAEAGYDCSLNTIDGPRGLLAAHSWKNGWSSEPIVDRLGEAWQCLNVAFKIFPAGGSRHNVIECTRQLVFEHDIKPEEVEKIDVIVAAQFNDMFERSYKRSFRPSSGYNMHGSWPCNIARMILSRYIGPEHLTMKALQEPGLFELADKVTCHPGTETDYAKDEQPTTVVITTRRGAFEKTLRKVAGHPETVTREDIVEKFRRNARLVIPDDKAIQIVEKVLEVEQLKRIEDLTVLTAA